jgi:hypothetical protein
MLQSSMKTITYNRSISENLHFMLQSSTKTTTYNMSICEKLHSDLLLLAPLDVFLANFGGMSFLAWSHGE